MLLVYWKYINQTGKNIHLYSPHSRSFLIFNPFKSQLIYSPPQLSFLFTYPSTYLLTTKSCCVQNLTTAKIFCTLVPLNVLADTKLGYWTTINHQCLTNKIDPSTNDISAFYLYINWFWSEKFWSVSKQIGSEKCGRSKLSGDGGGRWLFWTWTVWVWFEHQSSSVASTIQKSQPSTALHPTFPTFKQTCLLWPAGQPCTPLTRGGFWVIL